MKRWICFALLLSLCLSGCGGSPEKLREPVRFCYLREQADYGSAGGVMAWEDREAVQHETDYAYLLEMYLRGPEKEGLTGAFPRNVRLQELQMTGTAVKIVLNDFASLLTGLDLILACACLTATVTELTGAETVVISAETALLEGNASITMTRDQILWLDINAGQ